MTKDEAMKLALEALEKPHPGIRTSFTDALTYRETVKQAITALREALAEQPAQQEPVVLPCCGFTDARAVRWNFYNKVVQCHNCGQVYTSPQPKPDAYNRKLQAQLEQEWCTLGALMRAERSWQGLTEEEAAQCWNTSAVQTWKNIEAELKKLNT